MVSIRLLISFLFVFILIHFSDCRSIAHTHKDMKKTVAADRGLIGTEAERRSPQNEQVFEDDVPTAAKVEKTMVRGRKIMPEKSLGKEITKEEVSTISGAAHSVGHCNRRRKGILNVGRKLRNRKPLIDRKVKMAVFTTFSADYHVPKSHPPRNN